MLNADQIKQGLGNFYGTEQYHRVTIFPGIVGTDGVAWLAQNAECFWLIDEIAMAQRHPKVKSNPRLQEMQFWNLKRDGKGAILTVVVDSGLPPVLKKRIEYTDFPLDEIDLWVAPADENLKVIMLKTEY
jgi:hypothetical protein